MASKNLRNSFPALIVLLQNIGNKKLVHSLLTQQAISKSISEIVLNLLLGNVRLSAAEKSKLRPFQFELEQLIRKDRSVESKSKLLLRKRQGNILLKVLLVLVIPIVAVLLKNGERN